MELSITVCDVCQDPNRAIKRYSIQQGERGVTVDLCGEDGELLEKLLSGEKTASIPAATRAARAPRKTAAKKTTGRSTPRRGGRPIQETKIEDIR